MFGRGGQMNINHMLVAIVLIASLPGGAAAQSTPPRSVGKDLMTQDLTDLAGKQAVVRVGSPGRIFVGPDYGLLSDLAGKQAVGRANEYPPGAFNPPHRPHAH